MKPTPALAAAGMLLAVFVPYAHVWSQSVAPPLPKGRIEGRVAAGDGGPVELALVRVIGQTGG